MEGPVRTLKIHQTRGSEWDRWESSGEIESVGGKGQGVCGICLQTDQTASRS